jgi:hypothetical protein
MPYSTSRRCCVLVGSECECESSAPRIRESPSLAWAIASENEGVVGCECFEEDVSWSVGRIAVAKRERQRVCARRGSE